MTKEEAFKKIMKAADKYAWAEAHIEICEHHASLWDEIDEVRRCAKTRRWELEQMIKAALFAVGKEGAHGLG